MNDRTAQMEREAAEFILIKGYLLGRLHEQQLASVPEPSFPQREKLRAHHQVIIEEIVGVVQEMVRLLGKVVPADQDAMIKWAVDSKDSVYTNAGAAYWIGKEKLKEWGRE